jgi:hypothetical protein
MTDKLLTQQQLADELQVSLRTLERWRQQGSGPAFIRVGLKGAQTRSCCLSVLVEQAAKQVASLHSAAVILAQDGQPGGWVWRFQPKRPVGTMLVVVLDVGPQDLLKVAAADDQQPVQALGADRPHPALGVRVRLGCPHRRH